MPLWTVPRQVSHLRGARDGLREHYLQVSARAIATHSSATELTLPLMLSARCVWLKLLEDHLVNHKPPSLQPTLSALEDSKQSGSALARSPKQEHAVLTHWCVFVRMLDKTRPMSASEADDLARCRVYLYRGVIYNPGLYGLLARAKVNIINFLIRPG